MNINGFPLAICFVSNSGYLQHFYVALISFLEHNPGGHEIFLFNEDINEKAMITLQDFVKQNSPDSQLVDMKLDTSSVDHFTGYWEKLGKQVFHRLLIPQELPEKYTYALYMDADIVINDVLNFDDVPLEEYPVAAVKDNISDLLAPKRGLEKYFNAGIMLLNIKIWKEQNAIQKLLTHTPKITRFAEQELLNEVFDQQWFELPLKYNYAANHLKSGRQMQQGEKPAIIHYAGPIKPWVFWVKGSPLYWAYLAKTPFSHQYGKRYFTIFKSIQHLIKSRILKR